ncbi:putative extracellular ligand-binding receptor [Sulfitobacter noctilucicola]|uniref:Branched-chain amino acid transport system substrate-binding protein n=1 Tax=Sulfitobacter noctilucicola TaxID=1342301 RepID=A0A7W6MBI7_9RHOB|nr:ABC transporter substrate-binding protein [Sulfitobacter noctilucicola]KIN70023.1 putative extracellular ligand-binding receptor [Sulfitobacter noctilucicola]MBB4176036.1 branched-chain amino acid transport system substrate-binding protein [Sulfitobacter noctilucicola]
MEVGFTRKSFGLLGATAAVALALAGGALAEGHSKLKVGLITTLTGGGAALGVDIRDGFLLGIKQAGDVGIDVVVEDDQRKPDVAVKVADKMLQSEKVDIMTGIVWSNLALAVAPATTAQGKFYISPNAGPAQLAGRGCHENYFNVAWQNDGLHEAAGAHAKELGFEKPFILAPNYPAGTDALTGFKRTYEGELAGELFTQLGQTDYAAEIAQIRASGADGIFFFLPGGMGISFLKQYADSGIGLPVVGPAFSFDQTIVGAVGDAALGIHNTAQWSPDLDNEASKAFVETFKAEYGRIPSIYAQQAFDTANLIVSASAKADIKDSDAFREALRAADFVSTRGDFEFGNNQHPIQDFYVREVVKDGDVYTNKIIGIAMEDRQDVYAAECKL